MDSFEEGKELMAFWIKNLDKFTPFERQGFFSIITAKVGLIDQYSEDMLRKIADLKDYDEAQRIRERQLKGEK